MVQALQTQMAQAPATKKITPKIKYGKAPKPVKPPAKVAKKVAKPAPKPVKKVVVKKKVVKKVVAKPKPVYKAPPRKASKGGKGWFGDAGGAGDLSQWYGSTRKLYLPAGLFARSEVEPYLNGTLAGDYGYDPLGIGQSVAKVAEYREYEILHGRWAMLGAAGMIIPEGLAANGADIRGAAWYETGAEMLTGSGKLDYFAVPWAVVANPLPLLFVIGIQVGLMGAAENYRRQGRGPSGYTVGRGKYDAKELEGLDPIYPGGPFDQFGLASDPEVFQELKVKEIKNGRLAMIATLGFAVQAAVTGEGPYANWSKHVADPFGYNLLTVLGSEDRVPTL
ncbi:unnamed protein product [Ostreobium quekettii]|uniref:Chlorophyll a-b binding protein, chloroplastic n=1 Tax=Ostreobium quekettii TaxID=121088 RepID=A0A8S1IYC2_9CHLO|nr:unnamed protein product [Ostreobium quekettii]